MKRKTPNRKQNKVNRLENIQKWVDLYLNENDLQGSFESFVKITGKGKKSFAYGVIKLKTTFKLLPYLDLTFRHKKPFNCLVELTFIKWKLFIKIG
jgi:hypothetical protein